MPRNGDPRARHVHTISIKRTNSTRTTELSRAYPNYYSTPIFNNNPSQNVGFRRNNDQPYPPSYNGQQKRQQPYVNQRQSSFVPPTQPLAYTQAPRETAPAYDPILGAISQLMEKMTQMNSHVDENRTSSR